MAQELSRLIRKVRDSEVLVIGDTVLQVHRPQGGGGFLKLVITCPKSHKIIHARKGQSETLKGVEIAKIAMMADTDDDESG